MLFGMFKYMQMHTEQSSRVGAGGEIRLAKLIGSGGSGTVFRAYGLHGANGEGEELIAVKLPHNDASLVEEAAALTAVQHPNIVELIEDHTAASHGELAGALVLELCDGGTVEDLVVNRALDSSEVHLIVKSVGSALESIHAAGWIHGDVNPSNIGLRSNSTPALLDFGSCRRADGSPTSDETRGTIEFSQPQLPSSPTFDIRSLAATAHWALGETDEFSPTDHRVAAELRDLIGRCDSGVTDITLDDLYAVFADVPATRPTMQARPSIFGQDKGSRPGARVRTTGPLARAGGPDVPGRPRTRPFGPGPGGGDTDQPVDAAAHRPIARKALVAVGVFALMSLMGIEVLGHSSNAAAAVSQPATSVAAETESIPASDTLAQHDVIWSAETGSVEIESVTTTFVPGVRGDLAAMGDWNCNGTASLGIFRPSSGTWFTFDDWTEQSTSTVERIASADNADTLVVLIDSEGCASPSAH